MSKPLRQQLPYHPDSALLFATIREMPWAVFLDSSRPFIDQGRYDILAAAPVATLVTQGQYTRIKEQRGSRISKEDPLALLHSLLQPKRAGFPDLPFCGGAIGYFGYELGRRFEHLPAMAAYPDQLPDMAIGIYDWALVVDHQKQQSWLIGQGQSCSAKERWNDLVARFSQPADKADQAVFHVQGEIRGNMSKQQYAVAFDKIQRYIYDGDCYQVNLSQCFSVPVKGDPWVAYQALRKSNPAPYAAYLNTPSAQILSCSPELFLQVHGNVVKTKPIKGTAPRGADQEEDEQLIQQLIRSHKNRAENLMIVDLLRNDLGKGCKFGTIQVPELFKVESFATVHHLVSSITGMMADGMDAISLLRSCFPGGSITGAPKHRAMEIIDELEPFPRRIYTGGIGWIDFNGDMDVAMAIRTAVCRDRNMYLNVGGGIVADSDPEEEYMETLLKAEDFLRLLGAAECI